MSLQNILLLILTIGLSGGRNAFSKGVSAFKFGGKNFFFTQFLIFMLGSVVLSFFVNYGASVSTQTVYYGLIYGALLLSAQWCYTSAFASGTPSVCVTVYSLGFILPTLSGVVIWGESISVFGILGLLVAVSAVVTSGINGKQNGRKKGKSGYVIPLIIAMLSSGGLGIMQKVQQKSVVASERSEFVLIAFLFACAVSLTAMIFGKEQEEKYPVKHVFSGMTIGVCFASCNLLNTILAGALPSMFFFPVQNISVILLSLLINITVFREKLKKKDISVIILGIISILLLNLK